MSDWTFAHGEPDGEFARLHFFAIKRPGAAGPVEFRITVREYARPASASLTFFAQADKQTNQKTLPFTPCGWGTTLLAALSECIRAIDKFPYEGE